jgi:hypothetical protein
MVGSVLLRARTLATLDWAAAPFFGAWDTTFFPAFFDGAYVRNLA